MLKIGIVGAENSHCAAIAKLCNVSRKVRCRVVSVWGERPAFARAAAEAARIPRIVRDWREMLGQVDGVMIDHRHARYHAEAARFFVRHGVPCFVDKPFTHTLAEGRGLCRLAREKGVPITSFSTLPLQRSFGKFRKVVAQSGRIISLTTSGPADIRSKYGGIFFYGIHQVGVIVEILGSNLDRVHVQRHGADAIATLLYRNGPMVTMYCIKEGTRTFHWAAVCAGGIVDWTHESDRESPYLTGARIFTRMFRTGKEPVSHERILAPVAVLEALAKSLRLARPVRVARTGP